MTNHDRAQSLLGIAFSLEAHQLHDEAAFLRSEAAEILELHKASERVLEMIENGEFDDLEQWIAEDMEYLTRGLDS